MFNNLSIKNLKFAGRHQSGGLDGHAASPGDCDVTNRHIGDGGERGGGMGRDGGGSGERGKKHHDEVRLIIIVKITKKKNAKFLWF